MENHSQRTLLAIRGMHCASCTSRVENALTRVAGVASAAVNLASEQAVVEGDSVSAEALVRAVQDAGYDAEVTGERALREEFAAHAETQSGEERGWRTRLIGAVAITSLILLIHWSRSFTGQSLVLLALATAGQVYIGWPYYAGALHRLRNLSADMDTLVALGSTTAYAAAVWELLMHGRGGHYLHESPLLLTFITLGKWLETRARHRAGSALHALLDLSPKTARVVRDGKEIEISADAVQVGDIMVIRPGERVPTDAVIEDGRSTIDESFLTGESMPVEKGPGDSIYGSAINQNGLVRARATRVGSATVLEQIVAEVRAAQGTKAPVQRFADQVAARFVPIVIAIALASLVGHGMLGSSWAGGVRAAVAVLVVACPCALGLATPAAVMVAVGIAANNGILIRSAHVIEQSARLRHIVFDKTGTITLGRPEVVGTLSANGTNEREWLRQVGAVESASSHPLAKAIAKHAESTVGQLPDSADATIEPGKGQYARVDGALIRIGTAAFVGEHGVQIDASAEASIRDWRHDGKTVVFAARNDDFLGALALADPAKPEAPAVIAQVVALGCTPWLLTGDHREVAMSVARDIGLEAVRVRAEALPWNKREFIAQLQGEGLTAMVGDGVNDAPALAAADVGIAIGTGVDVAKESGDVIIVSGDLERVANMIELSRAAMRTIKQNLVWAFGYNLALIPLAALGRLDPIYASLAMAASSVSVVANSLLLRRRFSRREPGLPRRWLA